MSKIKVAVIGVGSIAESHIAGYKANKDVELYAFCDINEKPIRENANITPASLSNNVPEFRK